MSKIIFLSTNVCISHGLIHIRNQLLRKIYIGKPNFFEPLPQQFMCSELIPDEIWFQIKNEFEWSVFTEVLVFVNIGTQMSWIIISTTNWIPWKELKFKGNWIKKS